MDRRRSAINRFGFFPRVRKQVPTVKFWKYPKTTFNQRDRNFVQLSSKRNKPYRMIVVELKSVFFCEEITIVRYENKRMWLNKHGISRFRMWIAPGSAVFLYSQNSHRTRQSIVVAGGGCERFIRSSVRTVGNFNFAWPRYTTTCHPVRFPAYVTPPPAVFLLLFLLFSIFGRADRRRRPAV